MPDRLRARSLGTRLWDGLSRVPLRTKIFGIVLAATCSTGMGVLLWLNGWITDTVKSSVTWHVPTEFIVVLAIAMAVGLAVAWLLTTVLAGQVHQVTHVAQQVERGDWSQRAPVWADDDIGRMARAFNAMMDSLAQSNAALEHANAELGNRNEELTALYELALVATHATNAGEILPRALVKIADTCGARSAAILLSHAETGLSLHIGLNLPPALQDVLGRVSLNDPLIQQVFQIRQVVYWPERLDGDRPSALDGVARYAAPDQICALPLQSRGNIQGVVVLFQPTAPRFSFTDPKTAFVRALCSEISVAVDNIALWDEITRKEAMRARLLAKVVTAQEQERERISRELHDETGQSLTALLVQLRVFEHLQTRPEILAHAAELRTLVLDTLEEVRRLARDLRPGTLDELGLVPTIDWHVRTFTRNGSLKVDFRSDLSEGFRLPMHTELALYRVVQEALTNIARHAQATHASVLLDHADGVLSLTVQDDGRGFDVHSVMNSEERGLGLHGIQERVELIGGKLVLESTEGRGTTLCVQVPVQEKVNG
ncbi:MAG: histidine kinase [Anaerolineae bacterium]